MKKVALSLASVLAAAAFAPEASAVPAFARQTGMACTACHHQHFPVLNSFGRAFKASGFTIMGSQGKIEGEHLSIPDTLNAGVLLKVRYQKEDGTDPAGTVSGVTTNTGQWQWPDELGLFFAGRVADMDTIKVGMMMENNLVGTAHAAGAAGAPLIAGLRVPVVVDLGAAKLQVVPFSTDSLGAYYGYTESSNGINRAIRWMENRSQVFAHQFTGLANSPASGIAYVAHADAGYINVTRFASAFGQAIQMSSTAVHAAVTPTIADWATIISVEMQSGENYTGAATKVATKGLGFSAQAQGQLAGMETSVYFANSKTDKTAAGAAVANVYNGNPFDKTATQIGIDVSVVPHTLSIGANYLAGKTGVTSSESKNYLTFSGVYDLAQNVAVVANYSMGSGTAFNAGGSADAVTVAGSGAKGAKSLLTLMLEAAW